MNGHAGVEDDDPVRRLARERLLPEDALREKYGVTAVRGAWALPVDDPDAKGHAHMKRDPARWLDERAPKNYWPKNSRVRAKDLVYGLSHVERGTESAYIAAGEIDCITLLEARYAAVSFLAGEGTTPSAKAIGKLHEHGIRAVFIVYDVDEAGAKGAAEFAAACAHAGLRAHVVRLPDDLGEKGDINDLWRRCGGDRDQFVAALGTCPVEQVEPTSAGDPAERRPLVSVLADFLAKDWGAGEPIVEGWLSTGDIAWLYGQVGNGKTLEASEFALAVGTGRRLFDRFPTTQGTVLIVEEDCHPQKLQRYLTTLTEAYAVDDAPVFIWERQFLRLDDEESANAFFDEVLRLRPRLIILDAFLDLHSGDGFTGRELRPILDRIATLPQLLPCAVLVLDHTRKEETGKKKGAVDPIDALYGGRMKSAVADKMIFTRRISEVPLRFEVSMPKTRDEPRAPVCIAFNGDDGFTMDEVPTTLTPSAQTVLQWARRQPEDATFTKAAIVAGANVSLRAVNGALGELKYNRLLLDAGKQGKANLYCLAAWSQQDNRAKSESPTPGRQAMLSDLVAGGVHQDSGGVD